MCGGICLDLSIRMPQVQDHPGLVRESGAKALASHTHVTMFINSVVKRLKIQRGKTTGSKQNALTSGCLFKTAAASALYQPLGHCFRF